MQDNSRVITGAQTDCHERLEQVVRRNLESRFLRPIAPHNAHAYSEFKKNWQQQPLIIDSCCGTGQSSMRLANSHPDSFILGVDKSLARLAVGERQLEQITAPPDNLLLLRADLIDLYRLAAADGINLSKHFIYYPNPWPKSSHLQRRWHASAVFKHMLALGGQIEIRSNWQVYLEEFQAALSVLNIDSTVQAIQFDHRNSDNDDAFVSNFERKYAQSGQQLWQLSASIPLEQSSMIKQSYC